MENSEINSLHNRKYENTAMYEGKNGIITYFINFQNFEIADFTYDIF